MKSAIYYQEIDSTNLAAWRLIDQTPSPEQATLDGTIIWARTQTAGRGQWGRQWQSCVGGLYASTIVCVDIPADLVGQITLWSAWGIALILRSYIPSLQLKWPNDLVIDRYKLGGILTETRQRNSAVYIAVIGVGINGWNPVPTGGIGVKDLCTNITSLEMLLSLVQEGIALGKNRSQQEGMASILQEYRSFLWQQTVEWQGKKGVIVEVQSSGALCVLWEDSKRQVFPPGSLSLGYG